jgi:hypothetical protein
VSRYRLICKLLPTLADDGIGTPDARRAGGSFAGTRPGAAAAAVPGPPGPAGGPRAAPHGRRGPGRRARTRTETGHARLLATVSGPVTVARIAYRAPGAPNVHPADAELNLPEERHSHGLRRLAAVESARGSPPGRRRRDHPRHRRDDRDQARTTRAGNLIPVSGIRPSTTCAPRANRHPGHVKSRRAVKDGMPEGRRGHLVADIEDQMHRADHLTDDRQNAPACTPWRRHACPQLPHTEIADLRRVRHAGRAGSEPH